MQKLWKQDCRLRNTEKRISDAKALLKGLKAEVVATTSGHRKVFEQYNRSCREWQAEETRMERVNKALFHQDRPPRPLKLPDLPPSVLPLKEATRRLAGSQKTSTAQLTSAEESSSRRHNWKTTGVSSAEVPVWVGFTWERCPPQREVRRTPQHTTGKIM